MKQYVHLYLKQFKVKVEITDNFDRTYTADVD